MYRYCFGWNFDQIVIKITGCVPILQRMTMRFCTTSLAGAAMFLAASVAHAEVIDFSLAGAGEFASYTEQGVTFTATTPGSLIASEGFGDTPNGTPGLIGVPDPSDNFPTLRADIAGGATSVSINLGDFDSDPDLLFLNVYDSSNNLIDSTSLLTDASDESMHTLSLSDAGIAYAEFGSSAPSIGGSSVYADNFAWTTDTAATPEPSTLLLGAGGLMTLLISKFRRKV